MLVKYINAFLSFYKEGRKPHIIIFTTPRSGSTWLSQCIYSNKGIRLVDEPFNIRRKLIRELLGIAAWDKLYGSDSHTNIISYFNKIISGKYPYGALSPKPFARGYSMFSTRIVFKILHACEDKIDLISDAFNTRNIVLLRHPIPVTQSRDVYPRLDSLVKLGKHRFNYEQKIFIDSILSRGSDFELGILDWCLQNFYSLQSDHSNFIIVTYEQLLMDPEPVLEHLSEYCILNKDKLIKNIEKPSYSTYKSSKETQDQLKEQSMNRERLLNKWRPKVTNEEINFVQKALDIFGIDIYSAENSYPNRKYLISKGKVNI